MWGEVLLTAGEKIYFHGKQVDLQVQILIQCNSPPFDADLSMKIKEFGRTP